MKAILAAVAMLTAAASAQAQTRAVPPKVTMAPASGILDRDLRLFEAWFPGEFDNAEQHFFAEEQGVPVPRRTHASIAATGAHTFAFRRFADNDLTRPVEELQLTAAVDAAAGVIKVSAPGCEMRWTRRANQFAGEASAGSCGVKAATRYLLSAEDLWLGDDLRLMRARQWTCWIATPHDIDPKTSFFAPGLKIWDQGGEVWVKTDDPTPHELGYRLRQVKWPAGTNQDALTLYVYRKGEPRAVSYAWASPEANRIGINLRWMQGSCSR